MTKTEMTEGTVDAIKIERTGIETVPRARVARDQRSMKRKRSSKPEEAQQEILETEETLVVAL